VCYRVVEEPVQVLNLWERKSQPMVESMRIKLRSGWWESWSRIGSILIFEVERGEWVVTRITSDKGPKRSARKEKENLSIQTAPDPESNGEPPVLFFKVRSSRAGAHRVLAGG
jgi:hypothetical protein